MALIFSQPQIFSIKLKMFQCNEDILKLYQYECGNVSKYILFKSGYKVAINLH